MNTYSIMYDYSDLRGRIKAKLGTEGNFAKAIGRNPQYVSKVFHGKAYFDVTDITKGADILDIPVENIGVFFLNRKFANEN